MARAVVAVGSAVSFVASAVAGVLGNQLAADAVWAWVAFGVTLVLGAGVTAVVAHRSAGQAPPAEPATTVEGPVARGNVVMKGTYVAGHDLTVGDKKPQ